jgi:hypothetical protein
MLRLLWAASGRTRHFLRRYMPTNILLDLVRTRRGLKWGIPAMLLAVPYLLAAIICTKAIADGAPGWLNLLVLLFLWNTMKLIIIGPVSLALLIRVLLREAEADERTLAHLPQAAERQWPPQPPRGPRRHLSPHL